MSQIRYTNKDFDAIKEAMMAQIPVLAPEWTNLNEGEMGMALVNLVALVGDMLAFYQDRAAEECFLPTAKTRTAVQRLVALVGYKLARPVAAKTTLRFSLPNPAASNLKIPKYTVCKTVDGTYFTTKEDAIIYAGSSYVDVDGYQGQYVVDMFTGTGEDVQKFTLSRPNVAQNFLVVLVGNVQWEEDSFTTTPGASDLYEANTGDDEKTTIRFSRFLGNVPTQNATVQVHFIETKGEKGNIGSGLVNTIVSAIPGGDELSVTNTTPASGGKAKETLDEARMNAPRQLRTLNRAVTLSDFEDLLEFLPKVAKAQAVNHNGYAEIYAAPDGGGALYVEAPVIGLSSLAGGSLPAATYHVRVTAKDANGETLWWEYNPADRSVVDQTKSLAVALNDILRVTITEPAGATAFNVYVSNDGSTTWYVAAENHPADGDGTTVVDIASMPGTAATLPTQNTTGVRTEDGSKALRLYAEEYLEARRLIGTVFALFNPTYVPVNITATVKVYDNYQQSAVRGEVETALADFFKFESRKFGEDVYLSDLYQVIMDVEGVRSVSFTAPSGDVTINDGEIPELGAVTLTMSGGVV